MTSFGYDKLGRLTKVIDAAGKETVYATTSWATASSQTRRQRPHHRLRVRQAGPGDARAILPDGKRETKTYDAAGNLEDADGLQRPDHDLRLRRYQPARLADATQAAAWPPVGFTYTATGRRRTATDARGVTDYEYDVRDRLSKLTYPDGRRLEYGYDANGNRTTLTRRRRRGTQPHDQLTPTTTRAGWTS